MKVIKTENSAIDEKKCNDYSKITHSLKLKSHVSRSFNDLPQTNINQNVNNSLSSFCDKLQTFLLEYDIQLDEDKPLLFTRIWEIRKAQVKELLAMLSVTKDKSNDQKVVNACRVIINQKNIYPLGLFNRKSLPQRLMELFDEFKFGKVNFNWAYLTTENEISKKCDELLLKVETLEKTVLTEREEKEQLLDMIDGYENTLEDRISHARMRREDIRHVVSYIETRPRGLSFQNNYDTLLGEYQKLESKNKQNEVKLNSLQKEYQKIYKELIEARKQISALEKVEDVLSKLSENDLAQRAINAIQERDKIIIAQNTVIGDQMNTLRQKKLELVQRQNVNMMLRKEIKETKLEFEKYTKEKEAELQRLRLNLTKQELRIQQLEQQLKNLVPILPVENEIKVSNI